MDMILPQKTTSISVDLLILLLSIRRRIRLSYYDTLIAPPALAFAKMDLEPAEMNSTEYPATKYI
jgi:hypothetical protein